MRAQAILTATLVLIATSGCVDRRPVASRLPAAPQPAEINPQATALYADLWMQRAAEYEALTRQIYRQAEWAVLLRRLETGETAEPPAVVLDLDETVLDNSGFMTYLYRRREVFSSRAWEGWVAWMADQDRPPTVPGALEFLRAMEAEGIEPVYISNRREESRAATVQTLEKLGLLTAAEAADASRPRLLLRTDASGKEARRDTARQAWAVLAYFGDNLADFAAVFEAEPGGADERSEAVDLYADKWGVEWFVLPNPTYGDWVEALQAEPGAPLDEELRGPSELPPP